jgi:hypothetical protein
MGNARGISSTTSVTTSVPTIFLHSEDLSSLRVSYWTTDNFEHKATEEVIHVAAPNLEMGGGLGSLRCRTTGLMAGRGRGCAYSASPQSWRWEGPMSSCPGGRLLRRSALRFWAEMGR